MQRSSLLHMCEMINIDQWIGQDSAINHTMSGGGGKVGLKVCSTPLQPRSSTESFVSASQQISITLAIVNVALCKPLKSKLALIGKKNTTLRL